MRVARVVISDEEIDRALEEARNAPDPPSIVLATYHPERGLDLFVLVISDGRRLMIPREELQAVAGATPEQAAEFTTEPLGSQLWWTKLDTGYPTSALLEHRYGSDQWMERLERRGVAA